MIYIDGAARGNPGPAGVGIVLTSPGKKPEDLGAYLGEATNNVAETIALILALQAALDRGERKVAVRSDSLLLVNQVNGEYKVKNRELIWLHVVIRQLLEFFDSFEIRHVPREQNKAADKAANKAVDEGLKKFGRPAPAPKEEASAGPGHPTFW
jgi:ribonuclease HI